MINRPADRYGRDVLDPKAARNARPKTTDVPMELGMVVEDPASGFVGEIMGWENGLVVLEDRKGKRRSFPVGPGFWLDGKPVALRIPPRTGSTTRYTASGSRAGEARPAKVALPSRIYVEGRHDAELVEKVWGDDLRVEGVVVEYLQGVDLLDDLLRAEPPGPGRRYGVLVDHLVPGSKESRIAQAVERGPHGAHLRIVGHPHIDVWQCVRPSSLGIAAWPDVPRGIEWKVGVSRALGWPARDQADIARTWQRILGSVRSYRDLDPALLGRVEELIDFVTE